MNSGEKIIPFPHDRSEPPEIMIRINGWVITKGVSEDDFMEQFLSWLEEKQWSFFGSTLEQTVEEAEDDETCFLSEYLKKANQGKRENIVRPIYNDKPE